MPFGLTLEFSFVYYIFFTDLGLILFIILKNTYYYSCLKKHDNVF